MNYKQVIKTLQEGDYKKMKEMLENAEERNLVRDAHACDYYKKCLQHNRAAGIHQPATSALAETAELFHINASRLSAIMNQQKMDEEN